MKIDVSRRSFLRGIAGGAAMAAGSSFAKCTCGCGCGASDGRIRLAAVGVMGKGYSDWTPMVKSGLAKIVALCDADYAMREKAQLKLAPSIVLPV